MGVIKVANRFQPTDKSYHEVNDVDMLTPVLHLKNRISADLNLPPHDIEMIYAGQSMKSNQTLQSYGLKSGSMIYIFKCKPDNNVKESAKSKPDEFTVQQLMLGLQGAVMNLTTFRNAVNNLSRSGALNNILAALPGLSSDSVAINFLHDPDLLLQLTDKATVLRVLEAHPCLADAIGHVLKAVRESNSSSTSEYSYSLNSLSDDDQMETNSRPNYSADDSAPITSAQLASALAAVAASNPSGTAGNQSTSTPSTSESTSSTSTTQPIITLDMFTHAMQQVMPTAPPSSQNSADTQMQLEVLRAMGITDDAVSLQALQVTGGDVQAALELIFGDMTGPDNTDNQ